MKHCILFRKVMCGKLPVFEIPSGNDTLRNEFLVIDVSLAPYNLVKF